MSSRALVSRGAGFGVNVAVGSRLASIRISRRRIETYSRTIQFDTSAASCSSSNRSKIRVAVCRCFRGASRSSRSQSSITCRYGSSWVPASVVASWSSATPTSARQRPCGTRPGASAAVLARQPGTGVAPYLRIELDAGARGRQWSSPLLLVWVVEPEDLGEVRGVRHRARSGPGAINAHEAGGRDTLRPIGHQRSARHGSAPANRTGLPVTVPEGGSGGVRRRFRIGAHRGARGRRACRSAAPACPHRGPWARRTAGTRQAARP